MKILLIHGLSRTALSLSSLESYLQERGATTEQFRYLAFAESFDSIVERLSVHCQAIASSEPYGNVAHSLGGLLIRAALANNSIKLPEHIVMLGTPNQPPRLAPLAWKLLPFRWWTGHCGFNLTNPAFFKGSIPFSSQHHSKLRQARVSAIPKRLSCKNGMLPSKIYF